MLAQAGLLHSVVEEALALVAAEAFDAEESGADDVGDGHGEVAVNHVFLR